MKRRRELNYVCTIPIIRVSCKRCYDSGKIDIGAMHVPCICRPIFLAESGLAPLHNSD